MPTFGSRVLELRSARKWTQAKLAEEVGVTDGLVSHWENDARMPSAALLPILAHKLRTSVDFLLLGRE